MIAALSQRPVLGMSQVSSRGTEAKSVFVPFGATQVRSPSK